MRGYQGPKYAFQIRETLKLILSILKRRQNDVDPFAESGPVLLNWSRHNASNGSDNVLSTLLHVFVRFLINSLLMFCRHSQFAPRIPFFDGITTTLMPIIT